MRTCFLYCFMLIASGVWAQQNTLTDNHIRQAIDELRDFIQIPNDALEHADINRNLNWLTQKFGERGFNTSVLPTAGESLFFAALPMLENKPTLLWYMHFDGQSVDPGQWDQASPYKVVLKAEEEGKWTQKSFDQLNDSIPEQWRLFGRSVSDDKGPIVMFLKALDIIKATGREIPFNIKVILDGEEEKGSKPLAEAVETYKELLETDYLIIADGPVHPSEHPTLVFGCRGITTMSLTTYGPVKPQHSGHYGNYAPNPAQALATLLAGMKTPDGKVKIPGYYDGISLDEEILQVLTSVPENDQQIKERLQIAQTDQVGSFYQAALQYPSLNVRGLSSGWTGPEARTIVPASATAELDLRLVVESDGNRLKQLVRDYIEQQGYTLMDHEPTREERVKYPKIIQVQERGVTDAFRTDLDNPFGSFLKTTLETTFEKPVVRIRTMGGTVPIAPFVNALNVPAFILPMVNPDNNQHSPNENLKLGQFSYGIRTFLAVMTTAPN